MIFFCGSVCFVVEAAFSLVLSFCNVILTLILWLQHLFQYIQRKQGLIKNWVEKVATVAEPLKTLTAWEKELWFTCRHHLKEDAWNATGLLWLMGRQLICLMKMRIKVYGRKHTRDPEKNKMRYYPSYEIKQ